MQPEVTGKFVGVNVFAESPKPRLVTPLGSVPIVDGSHALAGRMKTRQGAVVSNEPRFTSTGVKAQGYEQYKVTRTDYYYTNPSQDYLNYYYYETKHGVSSWKQAVQRRSFGQYATVYDRYSYSYGWDGWYCGESYCFYGDFRQDYQSYEVIVYQYYTWYRMGYCSYSFGSVGGDSGSWGYEHWASGVFTVFAYETVPAGYYSYLEQRSMYDYYYYYEQKSSISYYYDQKYYNAA